MARSTGGRRKHLRPRLLLPVLRRWPSRLLLLLLPRLWRRLLLLLPRLRMWLLLLLLPGLWIHGWLGVTGVWGRSARYFDIRWRGGIARGVRLLLGLQVHWLRLLSRGIRS